jgi:hypothetical protein
MSSKNINRKLVKQIEKLLSELPSAELLALANTEAQSKEVFRIHTNYIFVSKCWKAMHSGGDDPLEPLLLQGKINKNQHSLIWQFYFFHNHIWELISLTFSKIKKTAKELEIEFPFSKGVELFTEIITVHADNQCSPCLSSYKEISHNNLKKARKFSRQAIKDGCLPPGKQNTLNSIVKNEYSNPWLKLAAAVWFDSTKPVVKSRVQQLLATCDDLTMLTGRLCRNAPSYAWVNGEKRLGNRKGTYT